MSEGQQVGERGGLEGLPGPKEVPFYSTSRRFSARRISVNDLEESLAAVKKVDGWGERGEEWLGSGFRLIS